MIDIIIAMSLWLYLKNSDEFKGGDEMEISLSAIRYVSNEVENRKDNS